jgi:hypothetical protein
LNFGYLDTKENKKQKKTYLGNSNTLFKHVLRFKNAAPTLGKAVKRFSDSGGSENVAVSRLEVEK